MSVSCACILLHRILSQFMTISHETCARWAIREPFTTLQSVLQPVKERFGDQSVEYAHELVKLLNLKIKHGVVCVDLDIIRS
jgi:hypothetical protein